MAAKLLKTYMYLFIFLNPEIVKLHHPSIIHLNLQILI